MALNDPKPHIGRTLFFQLMLANRPGILSIANVLNANTVQEAKILEKNITPQLLKMINNLYTSTYGINQITNENLNQWKMEKISQICMMCSQLLMDELKSFNNDLQNVKRFNNNDYNLYVKRCIAQCEDDMKRVNAILVTSSLRYEDAKRAIGSLQTTKPENIKNLLIKLLGVTETNSGQASNQKRSFIQSERLRHEAIMIKGI